MSVATQVPVIDLFAGPGGLGEGFSAARVRGQGPFRIAPAIEKDPDAHATLRLRSFFRQFALDTPHSALRNRRKAAMCKAQAASQGFAGRHVPETYYQHLRGELTRDELYARHPVEAERAAQQAWHAELGGATAPSDLVRRRIRQALAGADAWVLIGGPPCQAYSIAGRSRNRGVTGYRLERDERHHLYGEYLAIVADLWPPVFVVETVQGNR